MGYICLIFFLVAVLADASFAKVCDGCPIERDASDPFLNELLTTTLSKFKSAPQGTENELIEIVKIEKVFTQVIRGLKYIFEFEAKGIKSKKPYNCNLILISLPWKRENKVVDYKCQAIIPEETVSFKRALRLVPGGEVEIDLVHNKLTETLKNDIAQEINNVLKSERLMGVVKIFKATQQVASGILTKAIVEVARTNCSTHEKSNENCVFEETLHQVCNVEIWERLWLHDKRVTIKDCRPYPEFCAGCPREINPNDEDAVKCLKRSLFNASIKSHSTTEYTLLHMIRATRQIVAGVRYTYEFEAEDQNKKTYSCHAEIISQPWISNEPEMHSFKCSILN